MSSGRHAFAIMAHDQFDVLDKLVALLEHPRADVLLHLNIDDVGGVIQRHPSLEAARLVSRVRVQWGTYSLMEAQENLLKAALELGCDYVHLLSGKDLPLRPVSQIIDFMDRHVGTEFVALNPPEAATKVAGRVGRYYSDRLLAGKNAGGSRGIVLRAAQQGSLRAQGLCGVDRLRTWDRPLRSGSTWFSVTSELATYFVEHAGWADAHLKRTFVPEEFFYATMAASSPVKNNVWGGAIDQPPNLRHIKWRVGNRGHPHVWTMADLPELSTSDSMFARKFDQNVDAEVIASVIKLATAQSH